MRYLIMIMIASLIGCASVETPDGTVVRTLGKVNVKQCGDSSPKSWQTGYIEKYKNGQMTEKIPVFFNGKCVYIEGNGFSSWETVLGLGMLLAP